MDTLPLINVLHEDADLLVVHKPAGLVCHPTKAGPLSSLVSRVRIHLGDRAEPQMVHRLDRETSGVMIFGKNPAASAELRRLWSLGFVTKEYLALVHGHVRHATGVINAPLGPDDSSQVAIKDCVRPDGAPARTRYRVEDRFVRDNRPYSKVRLWLDTGRKHQIRLHLAYLGHPIVGDKIYGPNEGYYLAFVERRLRPEDKVQLELPWQALHADQLWLPWAGVEQGFHSAPESWFEHFWQGGPIQWPRDNEESCYFFHPRENPASASELLETIPDATDSSQ